MARNILIDEFHLSVRAPIGLLEADYQAIRRTLDDRHFQAALRRAIRGVFGKYTSLARARTRLSR